MKKPNKKKIYFEPAAILLLPNNTGNSSPTLNSSAKTKREPIILPSLCCKEANLSFPYYPPRWYQRKTSVEWELSSLPDGNGTPCLMERVEKIWKTWTSTSQLAYGRTPSNQCDFQRGIMKRYNMHLR